MTPEHAAALVAFKAELEGRLMWVLGKPNDAATHQEAANLVTGERKLRYK